MLSANVVLFSEKMSWMLSTLAGLSIRIQKAIKSSSAEAERSLCWLKSTVMDLVTVATVEAATVACTDAEPSCLIVVSVARVALLPVQVPLLSQLSIWVVFSEARAAVKPSAGAVMPQLVTVWSVNTLKRDPPFAA